MTPEDNITNKHVLFCLHSDPDSVSFCVLATDEEFECDIALQIHFTLIQSFCFDNDISIVRVSDMQRLAEIVGDKAGQLEDAHCVLITVCTASPQASTAPYILTILCSAFQNKVVVFHGPKVPFLLVSQQNPADGSWEDPALEKLHLFCEESRSLNDWVPEISLPER